jgi:hypothetical protein
MAEYWNFPTIFNERLPNGLGAAARSQTDEHVLHIRYSFYSVKNA